MTSTEPPSVTCEPALLRVLRGETLSPPPVWLMRQAGRYLPEYRALRARAGGFLDLCFTPELAAEVTLQPIRRFGFDAAILFSDILVVPHALGQTVAFQEGEGPVLDPLGSDWPRRLTRDGFLDRLEPVLETVGRVRSGLPRETALIGFCGAPWTVASYMVAGRGTPDQAPARLMAYRERESFSALIDLLVDVSAEYLIAQASAGAQAVQIFDSWAGSLPEHEFEAWSVQPTQAMVARIKARHPQLPVIGFPRGAGARYAHYAQATGVDAVACDTTLGLQWIRCTLQAVRPVQGNLDPLLLVAGGDRMARGIGEILEVLGDGPMIFNLGHGVRPETPPEHVERLVDLVRDRSGSR